MGRRALSFALVAPFAASMSTLARPALDGASLRYATLAARAAATAVDGATGLVWLEHVNIVVGDREKAEAFYFEEGLGCSRDPSKPGGPGSSGTMWANLGSQQFHLAEEAADDPPQAVRGALGLALPDVAAAAKRLQLLEARGACGPVEIHDADRFSATCPSGQQKRAKFPTSKAPISAVFHSFRLIFGRAIISRNGLEAWVLFPERTRAKHSR